MQLMSNTVLMWCESFPTLINYYVVSLFHSLIHIFHLVKCRLCPECSHKLNYTHKKKELTKRKKRRRDEAKKKKKKKRKKERRHESSSSSSSESETKDSQSDEAKAAADAKAKVAADQSAAEIWSKPVEREEEKSREDVFNEFLEDLFV